MDTTTSTRRARGLAVALTVAVSCIPASANAQYAGLTKSEAILSGAPSALAAILAQQSGQPKTTTVTQPQTLAPSGNGALYRPAILPLIRPAIALDRPDVFGSVALSVSRTPLDWRWRKVERARVSGAPASFAAALRDGDRTDAIDTINRFVNSRVDFVDDSREYRTADYWSAASNTLRRGRGDCEDYAIAKLQMLRAAGFADRDLYLVIVKDLVRRADHAVLVVRAEGRMLLLDNGTDRIADATSAQDYRPVLTYSAGRAWTHGYQRIPLPLQLATAPVESPATAALAVAATAVLAAL